MQISFKDLPHFPIDAAELVNRGRYILYTVDYHLIPDAVYVLITPGKSTCGCGHSDHPSKLWFMDKTGVVLTSYELDRNEKIDFIKESVRFSEPHPWRFL